MGGERRIATLESEQLYLVCCGLGGGKQRERKLSQRRRVQRRYRERFEDRGRAKKNKIGRARGEVKRRRWEDEGS